MNTKKRKSIHPGYVVIRTFCALLVLLVFSAMVEKGVWSVRVNAHEGYDYEEMYGIGGNEDEEEEEGLSKEEEKDLEKKLDKQEELEEKRDSYQNIITVKQNEAKNLQNQIASLSKRTESLTEDITQNSQELVDIYRDIASLEENIAQEEETITLQKGILEKLIESLYDVGNSKDQGGFLFAGENTQFHDQVEQMKDEVSITLENIVELKASLEADKKIMESKKLKTEELQAKLEQQKVYLESSKKQKSTLLVQTNTETVTYKNKLSKVEEELRDIEQEIEEIEVKKSGSLDYSSLPPAKKGYFRMPLQNVRITQNYGKTSFTRWYTFHNGTDFGAPTGTPIFSVRKGKVIGVGNNGRYAYGKWVVIDHGDGLVTLYGHMSKQKVKKGDSVKEGEIIGEIGSTGYSTGPHLHFSVFSANTFEVVNSSTVSGLKIPTGAHMDPMRYLK